MYKRLRKIVKVIEAANKKMEFSDNMVFENILHTWVMDDDYKTIINKMQTSKSHFRLGVIKSTANLYEDIQLITRHELELVNEYFNKKFEI